MIGFPKVLMYTDGACSFKKGGWANVLIGGGKRKEFFGSEKSTTSNRMELMAVISGLESIKVSCDVLIYSDSKYVVNGINKWVFNWRRSNWRHGKIKNIDLWEKVLAQLERHNVIAKWVARNSVKEQARCDELAKEMTKI